MSKRQIIGTVLLLLGVANVFYAVVTQQRPGVLALLVIIALFAAGVPLVRAGSRAKAANG